MWGKEGYKKGFGEVPPQTTPTVVQSPVNVEEPEPTQLPEPENEQISATTAVSNVIHYHVKPELCV